MCFQFNFQASALPRVRFSESYLLKKNGKSDGAWTWKSSRSNDSGPKMKWFPDSQLYGSKIPP